MFAGCGDRAGSERGALHLEGVCGTLFGGRVWSSDRGALSLEGVCGNLCGGRFGGGFWSSERRASVDLDAVKKERQDSTISCNLAIVV